jgi:hypothetical protein
MLCNLNVTIITNKYLIILIKNVVTSMSQRNYAIAPCTVFFFFFFSRILILSQICHIDVSSMSQRNYAIASCNFFFPSSILMLSQICHIDVSSMSQRNYAKASCNFFYFFLVPTASQHMIRLVLSNYCAFLAWSHGHAIIASIKMIIILLCR